MGREAELEFLEAEDHPLPHVSASGVPLANRPISPRPMTVAGECLVDHHLLQHSGLMRWNRNPRIHCFVSSGSVKRGPLSWI